jgi:hypothetical protein
VRARSLSVEGARNLDLEAVLAVIVEEQRLGAALGFVVAAVRADLVDVAPILFRLRIDGWVTVGLSRRRLDDRALQALGDAQHVDRAVHGCLGRLHEVMLLVDR